MRRLRGRRVIDWIGEAGEEMEGKEGDGSIMEFFWWGNEGMGFVKWCNIVCAKATQMR